MSIRHSLDKIFFYWYWEKPFYFHYKDIFGSKLVEESLINPLPGNIYAGHA